jgi:anti-sigma regulatory factor (Ser/Thr protein kinase)
MAFNFNAVDSQLQDKANIFQPTGNDQNAAQSQNQGASTFNKTTSGGTVSHTGTSSTNAQNPKGTGSGGSYNPVAAQAAFDAAGPGNFKPVTDKIGGTIANANAKLQEAANTYTKKADTTAAGYKIDNATLAKAAEGDDTSFSTVASRLSKTQPDQFEAFSGLKDEEIPTAANAVSKPSVFGDIYRPTAGADYSNGENKLNSMQLRRSGDFRAVAAQLGNDQAALEGNNAKQQDELTTATRDKLANAYTAATGEARSTLNNMGETIIKTAKDQELADEARRQGLDVKALTASEFEKLKPQILASMKAAGLDRSMSYLDDPNNFGDLSNYLKLDTDVDYTDFIDQGGADKYNRINSLLGNGGAVISPTEKDSDYSFDVNNARSYIDDTVHGKRQEADRGLQSQIDALMAQAGTRASSVQGDALQNAQDYVTRKYIDQNEGQTAADIAAEKEAYRQLFNPETKWNDYYTSQGGLTPTTAAPRTAMDMLTPKEAAQLNELAKQIGSSTTYQAGSQYNTSNYNPEYFDNLFNKTFSRVNGEINGTVPMTSGGGITRDRTVNPLADAQANAAIQKALDAFFNRGK